MMNSKSSLKLAVNPKKWIYISEYIISYYYLYRYQAFREEQSNTIMTNAKIMKKSAKKSKMISLTLIHNLNTSSFQEACRETEAVNALLTLKYEVHIDNSQTSSCSSSLSQCSSSGSCCSK